MSAEYVKTKIDGARQGFTEGLNQLQEARNTDESLNLLTEAADIFSRIMVLATEIQKDLQTSHDALRRGEAHTKNAFAIMEAVGDFSRAGDDDTSMMRLTQRVIREVDANKPLFERSLAKYDDQLTAGAWSKGQEYIDSYQRTVGSALGSMDEAITKHQEVLTALADYESRI